MTREEAIDIIKAERACVERQGRTGECCRDDLGCGACDLVMEDVDIIKAYDMAIEVLKERPHGTWERVDKWVDGKYVGGFIHKECPMIKISDDCLYAPWTYNFCPNCGADMRKVIQNE